MVNGQHPRAGSPLVSVIVPTYNYGHLLPETIHCLQAQSLTDWECIIVDDGSTDETRAAAAKLEEADHRVSYLQRNHQGVSPARNVGLQAASGKYIQLLDADDLIEASKLKEQVSWLEEHPATDLVYGSARFFNHDHPDERRFRVFGEDQPWIPELSGGRNKLLPALIRENIMPINCPLFRASILEHIGLFDESLSTMEDWDFWLRCALGDKRFQFHDGQATLALVRYHPTSASTNYRRMMDGYIRVRTKLLPLVSEPYLAEFNRSKLDYLAECLTRIDALLDDLTRLLPADARFILADDGQLQFMGANHPRAVPFLERDGKFWGAPADDHAAICELERLRGGGAEFIAIAWPAFWWLDHYTKFHQYLRTNFRCMVSNDQVILFDLRVAS